MTLCAMAGMQRVYHWMKPYIWGMTMKSVKKIIAGLVLIGLLLATSIIVSVNKFNTSNPFMSGMGLIRILFSDTEIVLIQEYPQVYLAKPDHALKALIGFMEQRGFDYFEDERIASTLAFKNEVSKHYVDFSVNAYYSKWVFRE